MDLKILQQQLNDADERVSAWQKKIDKIRAEIAESDEAQEIEKLREALERLELAQTLYQGHRDLLAASIM